MSQLHILLVHSFLAPPKFVKISTNETTPKYSLDTCLAFLCGTGTSMWTGANVHWHKHVGRGHLQKGSDHAVKAPKPPSMAGWKALWAPGGEVCSGLDLVLLWLHCAWIFTLGEEQDKYVSLQHFMKQSNADIYKWDMTWSVQIVSLE